MPGSAHSLPKIVPSAWTECVSRVCAPCWPVILRRPLRLAQPLANLTVSGVAMASAAIVKRVERCVGSGRHARQEEFLAGRLTPQQVVSRLAPRVASCRTVVRNMSEVCYVCELGSQRNGLPERER